jgi:hypothetical protein
VLYANPGYAIRINELPEDESDRNLAFLFEHQLQQRFRYLHRWTEGDLLMWDDLLTLHNAQADYGPDEKRLIKRCQVMADRIFDPDFMREALGERTRPDVCARTPGAGALGRAKNCHDRHDCIAYSPPAKSRGQGP